MPTPNGTRTRDVSRTSEALTAQYTNVSQRKLGTIIIQTVRILQHDSADAGSMLLFQAPSKLLPNNPARQYYVTSL